MKRPLVAILLVLLMASVALAVETPHNANTGLGCTACHEPSGPTGSYSYDMTITMGVNNLCVNCHKPGVMEKSFSTQDIANPFGSTDLGNLPGQKQTSHNWAAPTNVPGAGAEVSLNPAVTALLATKKGFISCASCHGQHTYAGDDLMRSPNNTDQLCLDCHRSRNQKDVQKGTHPIDFEYATSSKVLLKPGEFQPAPVNANPANPTSAMKLVNGKVLCSTCHGVHFTDSNARTVDGPAASALGQLSSSQGFLLRTDLRGGKANDLNICTNCHTGKMAHNRKGQNIQCADCHGAHVDPGDGSDPNVWLVRRYMNYSGGVKLDSYRRKVLNQGIGAQSNFAGEFGVCQGCHAVPAPGGSYPSEHASQDPTVCVSCHAHDSASGSFSADCTSCHGMPPVQNVQSGPEGYAKTSQFDYKTSGVFKDESLSGHAYHAGTAGLALTCSECHAGNNHATGNFQQVFKQTAGTKAALNGANPSYNANGTCATTYCHSNGATGALAAYKEPAWANAKGSIIGTAGECNACHDATPATNAHGGHLAFGFACEVCHSATATGSKTIKDSSKHVNGVKDVLFSGMATYGGTGSYNDSLNSCSALYCHSNGNKNNLIYAAIPAWNSGTKLGCNGCHGTGNTLGAPDYANGGPGAAAANSHNAHVASTADCSSCHFTTISATGAPMAAHLSGSVDVVFNPAVAGPNATYNPVNKTCANVACHGNSQAQWGSKGGCLGCHSASINNRAAITNQFNGNSHHVQGTLISGEHCYQCHWEANSDGSINGAYHRTSGPQVDLVVYGAGTRPTANSTTTAVQYIANGSRTEMTKINSHCIGCHSDANKTITPFGDGKTPAAYAWDANSIAAKFGDTGTTPWGKYAGTNVTPKSTVTKAFSAHGNVAANKGGWNTTETWADRAAASNVLCFDCHNSHGSTVEGKTTSYTSATVNGGILKDTVAGKSGYAVSYKPAAGGSAEEHNTYNPGAGICFDCHMKDTAVTTPWGYKSTFGATQQIMGYNDSAYFGNNTFGNALRYTYKGAVSNKGGHFGASATLSSVPAHQVGGLCTPCHDPHGVSPAMGANKAYGVPLLKGTWMTSPYKEDVSTIDNKVYKYLGADPSGDEAPIPTAADKAAYKVSITTSYHIDQNTFTSGNITQTVDQFAGLCLNCHAKTTLTNGTNHTWKSKDRIHESVKGWKTANTTVKHNYSCSKCHAPHNAKLPRLMVSNCLDAKHRGRETNNTSPETSSSYVGSEGRGAGHIPGVYEGGQGGRGGWSGWSGWNGAPSSGTSVTVCHENNDATQKWNNVTQWALTPAVAPSVPVLTAEPDLSCTTGCSATLLWSASTNTNAGAATEYLVEVSTTSAFTTVQSSGWIATTSYIPLVSTGNTYYWRVQARDKTKTNLVSAWSAVDSFVVSNVVVPPTGGAPSVPVIVAEPDFRCSYSSCSAALNWSASVNTNAGAATQYQVQVSRSSSFSTINYSSGWISNLSYTPSVTSGYTYYWRVQARDKTKTTLVSAWSTVDSFVVSK